MTFGASCGTIVVARCISLVHIATIQLVKSILSKEHLTMAKVNNESREKMANMNSKVEGTTVEGAKTSISDKRRSAFEKLKRDFEAEPNNAAAGMRLAMAVAASVLNRLNDPQRSNAGKSPAGTPSNSGFCPAIRNLLNTLFEGVKRDKLVAAGNDASCLDLNVDTGKIDVIVVDKEQYALLLKAAGMTSGDGVDILHEAYLAIWEAYTKWGKGNQLGWLDKPVKVKKMERHTYGSYADAASRVIREVDIEPIVLVYRHVRKYIADQRSSIGAHKLEIAGLDDVTLETYYIKNKMYATISGDFDADAATVNEWDAKKCEDLYNKICNLFTTKKKARQLIDVFSNTGSIRAAAAILGRSPGSVCNSRNVIKRVILEAHILTDKQLRALGINPETLEPLES
mgnify:CR=1 FL=1